MKVRISKKNTLTIACLIQLIALAQSTVASQNPKVIDSNGWIAYSPLREISIDIGKTIGSNNLSVGFQISYGSGGFVSNPQISQLAKDANFKIVRFFDSLASSWVPSMMPCTYFNEATKTGTYDWTNVDDVIGKMFEIGAEPLICLGTFTGGQLFVPSGMAITTTGLPNPESYAAYCAEWVKHFKAKGWNVRFYEIGNEVFGYFGWDPVDFAKLAHFMSLFNACAANMRQANLNVLISFDFIGRQPVLDYWLANGGADIDSINFHKYGDWRMEPLKSDAEMLQIAEEEYFGKWPLGYSVNEARQVWFNARGKLLPIICSEGNFNAASEEGTDPRNQQMVGAVWTALVLRMGVLNGLSYNVYFELASSAGYGKTTSTGGAGFGMVNCDDNAPWYPYYVHYMIGNNLGIGDLIKESSSTEEIRTITWVHGQTLNILLVCKVDEPRTVRFYGVTGQGNFTKIDSTISWQQPSVQKGTLNFDESFVMNGYTVALLQKPA